MSLKTATAETSWELQGRIQGMSSQSDQRVTKLCDNKTNEWKILINCL